MQLNCFKVNHLQCYACVHNTETTVVLSWMIERFKLFLLCGDQEGRIQEELDDAVCNKAVFDRIAKQLY